LFSSLKCFPIDSDHLKLLHTLPSKITCCGNYCSRYTQFHTVFNNGP
jgi:hypothetical protein